MRSNLFAIGILAASILFFPRCGYAGTHASWHGDECKDKLMANGKPFNPSALTCASWDYPLGTWLKVCHKDKIVRVLVTDRGPARRLYRQGRKIDLSRAAFVKLASPELGLIQVTIQPIKTK